MALSGFDVCFQKFIESVVVEGRAAFQAVFLHVGPLNVLSNVGSVPKTVLDALAPNIPVLDIERAGQSRAWGVAISGVINSVLLIALHLVVGTCRVVTPVAGIFQGTELHVWLVGGGSSRQLEKMATAWVLHENQGKG